MNKSNLETLLTKTLSKTITLKRFYHMKNIKLTNNEGYLSMDDENNLYIVSLVSKDTLDTMKEEFSKFMLSCVDMIKQKGGHFNNTHIVFLSTDVAL